MIYPLCLLAGSLLAVVAGALHPDLAGDGATQLAAIARCPGWRAIHWAFLFGFPLALTGLVGVVGVQVGTPGEGAARAGLMVGTLAYAAWVVVVAFMGGAGWALAQRSAGPDAGAAAQAAFVFDAIHPFALAAQRAAGFALGISTYLFGRGMLAGGRVPRWLGTAGVTAGLVGMILALVFREDTKADQAAFVLPVLWQVGTAVVMLRMKAVSPES